MCATHIATCPRRSVGMDAWSSDQLKRMQLGGNDKLNNFLQKYGVSKDTDIKEKYNSTAAEVRLPARAALTSLSPLLFCCSAGGQLSPCLLKAIVLASCDPHPFPPLLCQLSSAFPPCLLKAIRRICILPALFSSPTSMLIVFRLPSADLQPPGAVDLQGQAESGGGGQAVHSASALTSICPEATRSQLFIAAQHHKQQCERRRLG